jgi:hypothetical protein
MQREHKKTRIAYHCYQCKLSESRVKHTYAVIYDIYDISAKQNPRYWPGVWGYIRLTLQVGYHSGGNHHHHRANLGHMVPQRCRILAAE